ncbi:DUF3137 domain-containing protein [Saccharicrinis aurantiacus]|uniref:DUF3137 domain-containing protein n=1 Tax=Saccharicrinis aurantiacus TaxID=1849719 RepID=UPI00094F7837|nr:DUF3137 domain-containing protein [Saccharicrinis aurantiacus]
MEFSNKDFDTFFAKIYPVLEEVEIVRKKWLNEMQILFKWFVAFLVSVPIFYLLIPIEFTILQLVITALTFYGLINGKRQKAFKELTPIFKNKVITELLLYFYEDVRYLPRQRMSPVVLTNSLLLGGKVKRTTGDDYTECRIGNTHIHFSEVQAWGIYDIFFTGIFIAVRFNKTFTSKTVIMPRSNVSLYTKVKIGIHNEMNIKLEDIEFRKEFTVVGEDQVESRYKLTPSLMHRMLEYKKKVNKKVAFSLIDNWLYVAIPNNVNLFEVNLLKPITSKEFMKTHFDYFELLTGLVNDLDLNTKIWK